MKFHLFHNSSHDFSSDYKLETPVRWHNSGCGQPAWVGLLLRACRLAVGVVVADAPLSFDGEAGGDSLLPIVAT
jgi:hypothetical protein